MDYKSRLARIAQEIADLQKRLTELRRDHNAVVPIGTLPNEILAQILFEHASITDTLYSMAWLPISSTCHRWHEVARGTPTLWSYIDFGLCCLDRPSQPAERRISMQREHAGACALSLRVTVSENAAWPGAYDEAFAIDPSQIRSLNLKGRTEDVDDFFATLPPGSYPLLQYLSVQAGPDRTWAQPRKPAPRVPLFVLKAPKLRSIQLRHVRLDLTPLHGLTSLSTNFMSTSPSYNFDDIAAFLANSPSLRILRMELPAVLDTNTQVGYLRIAAPALEKVALSGPPHSCALFLSVVALPPRTQVFLNPSRIRSGADTAELMVAIRKHVRRATAPLIQGIIVHVPFGPAFEIFCFTDPDVQPFRAYNEEGYLSLISYPESERERRRILAKTLHALPSAPITHLSLSDQCTKTTWHVIFDNLPSLTYVYSLACGEAAGGLLDALLERAMRQPSGAGSRARPLSLRYLHWDTLGLEYTRINPSEYTELVRRVMERTVHLLRILSDRGTPLEVLELELEGMEGVIPMDATGDGMAPVFVALIGEWLVVDGYWIPSTRPRSSQ